MKPPRIAIVPALILCLIFSIEVIGQGRFEPTVILVALDGMRNDYLTLHRPPELMRLASGGVRARWMIPAYPTKTFPNHYTVATGLYPGNHGLIENNMFDEATGRIFRLGDRNAVQDPMWWGGEPVWVTAQKQGLVAASYFFPGTETPIGGMRPRYWRTYDGDVSNDARVDAVLSWLDLEREQRPRVITLYFSEIDDAGHEYGPDDPRTTAAVLNVDRSIARLTKGLRDRGAEGAVNLILFSDHGMAPYKMRDAVVLDKYFDPTDAERIFWVGEFTQIFPKPGNEEKIYRSIKSQLPKTARIHRRDEIPKRFNLGSAKRLPPILVVPQPGTIITNKERYGKALRESSLDKTRGGHGYDNFHPLMRATFIAYGPSMKRGHIASPFENIHVYELMCKILGLRPAPNDGDLKRVRKMLR